MAVKRHNPTTPSMRFIVSSTFEELTTNKPEKSLLDVKRSQAGRNNQGKITIRHRCGGVRKHYRIIDFKRNKDGIPARVATIEYDPNRTAYIALLNYVDGEKRYILAPVGLTVGATVQSGEKAEIKVGNNLPLQFIPIGTTIHNVELHPGKGGQFARSAGMSAQLVAKEGKYATIKMPSGELRLIPLTCRATIGTVSNPEHELVNYGKAGRIRHMGVRPHVRGVVMNPNDHPHGGGEGKSPIGHDAPRSPWGKRTQGVRTRNKKKSSTKRIISRRDAKKGR